MLAHTKRYVDNVHLKILLDNIFAYGHIHLFHALSKLDACSEKSVDNSLMQLWSISEIPHFENQKYEKSHIENAISNKSIFFKKKGNPI